MIPIRNTYIASNRYKHIGNLLKFYSLKFGKWILLLFKPNKKLKNISFNYLRNWHVDNAYLIIDFKFKNAIWFKIGKFKSTDFNHPLALNLQVIHSDVLEFEVYGFLQKQTILIQLSKELKINTEVFKTKILTINNITLIPNKTLVKESKVKTKITMSDLRPRKLSIEINHSNFKIQDYI